MGGAVLKKEDDVMWAKYAETRSIEDRNALVVRYLVLCEINAARLSKCLPAYIAISDLYQAGVLGLIQAVERFNPSLGCRFATYANHRVRGEMQTWIRDKHDWMKRWLRKKNPDIVMLSYDAVSAKERNALDILTTHDTDSVRHSQMTDLKEVMKKLSQQNRDLLHMLLHGLSQVRISKICGITPGGVSYRVNHLIRSLRDLIGVQIKGVIK